MTEWILCDFEIVWWRPLRSCGDGVSEGGTKFWKRIVSEEE